MRVKRGTASRRRHKRMLQLAEGFRGRRKNCFKLAKRAVQKSQQYATRDRRVKKREFRQLWIARINAAVRLHGLSYSRFQAGLTRAKIEINRKVLADLAVRVPAAFASIAEQAKRALN